MSNMNDRPTIPGLRPTGMSRRSVLRALGIGGAVAAGGPLLAACGTEGSSEKTTQNQAAPDKSDTDKRVVWSNWPGYIDYNDDETKRPSVDAFEKKTGIKVTYNEDINDNDEFFGKIRTQLNQGQDTGRDVIVLTDWMAGRLIRLSYVQELNKANIPNAKNLVANLQNVGFDPGRKQSLPWQSGFTAIGTNGKALKDVAGITDPSGLTVNDLLTNPKLKGRVTVLTEMRDTMGLIMLDMGKKPEEFTDDDFNAAIAKLGDAVDSGQVRENIFSATAGALGKEDFFTLLESNGVKVERVVSHAASSPEEFWYDQAHAEWVMIVRGEATLEFESGQRIEMKEGAYLTIPPHTRHRVHQTGPETIWLVVHVKEIAESKI